MFARCCLHRVFLLQSAVLPFRHCLQRHCIMLKSATALPKFRNHTPSTARQFYSNCDRPVRECMMQVPLLNQSQSLVKTKFFHFICESFWIVFICLIYSLRSYSV